MAVCTSCGAYKDLALGRCPACGHLPDAAEREVAVACSSRFLTAAELAAVQARVRRGERLDPSPARRAAARAVLAGRAEPEVALDRRRWMLLALGNLLVTPLLGWALWLRWWGRPGPGARQALWATVPASLLLAAAWVGWIALRGS